MVVSLRTGKAKLSSLIARAERGEEVLITVRGRPRARLTALPAPKEAAMASWVAELRALHRVIGGRRNLPAAKVVSDLREDR